MSEDEKDRQAWQSAFGGTGPDKPEWDKYTADDFDPPADGQVLRGAEAAASGRELLARHLGGDEAVDRAISGRGRPSVGATRPAGASTRLQVLVDNSLLASLTDEATRQGVPLSEVMRAGLRFYFAHRAAS